LPAPELTYSDWITYPSGSTTRLERLRLYIQELSNLISTGNYSNTKGSRDKDALQRELADLRKVEQTEATAAAALTGRGSSFTRARVLPL